VAGRVRPRYGYDGGGLHLLQAGAILAGDLPASKARLLVMVALGFAATVDEARRLVMQATQ
jgi:L-asparaginase